MGIEFRTTYRLNINTKDTNIGTRIENVVSLETFNENPQNWNDVAEFSCMDPFELYVYFKKMVMDPIFEYSQNPLFKQIKIAPMKGYTGTALEYGVFDEDGEFTEHGAIELWEQKKRKNSRWTELNIRICPMIEVNGYRKGVLRPDVNNYYFHDGLRVEDEKLKEVNYPGYPYFNAF